ncbi:GAF and ANTAR domain-containing protein, partial [Streptomyces sp. NRRL F-5123]|uniref:GAF and ANTAR domain-containing protein n=1 Tax=Streptomyces sp. NRRL F-5123 TaxID=1463856 RepID=UPI001F472F45
QKTAYDISACLVGSEMCIRDRAGTGQVPAAGLPEARAGDGAGAGPGGAARGGAADGGQRERLLAGTLLGLGDGLDDEAEDDAPLRELAARLPRLARVAAAGVLLAGEDGELRVVGASCEPARLLAGQGPGPGSYHEGAETGAPDLDRGPGALPPDYARRALRAGYRAVFALPLRHRKETVGALVLFRAAPGPLDTDRADVVRALADAAALGVLQRRTRRHHARLAAQLQTALDTRVPVEQAKGLLAERFQVSVDVAFDLLRTHARAQRLKVADLAAGLLDGTVSVPGPS